MTLIPYKMYSIHSKSNSTSLARINTYRKYIRATWKILPFNNIPTRVIIEVVIAIYMWIKMFPITDRISTKLCLSTLVTGIQVNFKNIATSSLYLTPKHIFVFSSGHRDQITCSLLGGFSKPKAEVTRLLDSGL